MTENTDYPVSLIQSTLDGFHRITEPWGQIDYSIRQITIRDSSDPSTVFTLEEGNFPVTSPEIKFDRVTTQSKSFVVEYDVTSLQYFFEGYIYVPYVSDNSQSAGLLITSDA